MALKVIKKSKAVSSLPARSTHPHYSWGSGRLGGMGCSQYNSTGNCRKREPQLSTCYALSAVLSSVPELTPLLRLREVK